MKTRIKHSDPAQLKLFGLIWRPYNYPFRLRANDVIRVDGRLCRVIRVTDCAAVVEINQPVKEFKTLFGKEVHFRPRAKTVRICPNSETHIFNRKAK